MEALVQPYQAAGFSKEVSRLPEGPLQTECMKTSGFASPLWVTGQGIDPFGPTAAHIAASLYYLFDTHGLSPHTIKGYRSCLASVLSRTGNAAAVQAKTI